METTTAAEAPTSPADSAQDEDRDPVGTYGELEPEQQPLFDLDGRVRLSYSRLDTYSTCPAKFRYRYIDRLPSKPSPHLSFGTSIHAALERFYDRKLPECPSKEALLEYLYEEWDSSGFQDMTRDEQVRWYRHAQDVLARYHDREAPAFRLPATVEQWFELPFGEDALVVGSIDRVDACEDGTLEVLDYKTNKRVRDRDAVRGSLQLAIYALACEHLFGRLPTTVTLYFVVPGIAIRVPIDEIDLDAARSAVHDVANAVRREAFMPQPNRLCDWCDYRTVCPAWDGDGPEVLGPAVQRLEQLRRRVRRDVRTLRHLEAGVDQLTSDLHGTKPAAGQSP